MIFGIDHLLRNVDKTMQRSSPWGHISALL